MSDGDEEEVVIHTAEVVESTDEDDQPKQRHYERVTPLPNRIRDGSFEEEFLVAAGQEVPWSSVQVVALGVIDQMVRDSELKKGPLRKMVKKVTGGEESDSAKDRAKTVREVYLLDVFTDVQEQPFRFEGGSINYKSFLDKVGYVSHHNFFRFCVHFARRVTHAKCTTSLEAFVAKRRDRVAHYNDYHDFELELVQQIRLDRDLIPIEEIDLSRDSWMEEWSLDDI